MTDVYNEQRYRHDGRGSHAAVNPAQVTRRKVVVFVGGTAYSGSTLIDMMLANDPRGLSCGEVNAVFHPYRRKHLRLGELSDVIDWRDIKRTGAARLYERLFQQFPDVDFLVDSSKSPLWISERAGELAARGILARHILIWKDPEEFLLSRRKRRREFGWAREWLNYHRYYFSMVEGWRSVRYSGLVGDAATLERVCRHVEMPHFAGKEQYWNRRQHTLFGNDRAKVHLYDETSAEFIQHRNALKDDVAAASDEIPHRSIHRVVGRPLTQYIGSEMMRDIKRVLEYGDVANQSFDRREVQRLSEPLACGSMYGLYQRVRQKYGLGWIVDLLRG